MPVPFLLLTATINTAITNHNSHSDAHPQAQTGMPDEPLLSTVKALSRPHRAISGGH